MHSSSPPSVLHVLPSQPPWLDHFNYTWRRVQVMKLLIMQFFPASFRVMPLASRYSPQHPLFSNSYWNELGSMWKDSVVAYFEAHSRNFL
jgi:hypothetical protein